MIHPRDVPFSVSEWFFFERLGVSRYLRGFISVWGKWPGVWWICWKGSQMDLASICTLSSHCASNTWVRNSDCEKPHGVAQIKASHRQRSIGRLDIQGEGRGRFSQLWITVPLFIASQQGESKKVARRNRSPRSPEFAAMHAYNSDPILQPNRWNRAKPSTASSDQCPISCFLPFVAFNPIHNPTGVLQTNTPDLICGFYFILNSFF